MRKTEESLVASSFSLGFENADDNGGCMKFFGGSMLHFRYVLTAYLMYTLLTSSSTMY